MKNVMGICYIAVSVMLSILFIPVLFSLIVWGNKLGYYDNVMLPTLLPNAVIFFAAVLVIVILGVLLYLCRSWRLTPRCNLALDAFLTVLFVGLYFLNVEIAKELIYYTGQDAGIVRACAHTFAGGEPLGYNLYLVINTNNIPITYILGKLIRLSGKLWNYPYNGDFLCVQANCLFLSVGGWAACMTVKRQTQNIIAVAASAVIYLACVGFTPWKIIPYTDTYSMAFPVLAVCFYVYYRHAEHRRSKVLYLFLAYFSVSLGGFVKQNVYLVAVAFLLVEAAGFLENWRDKWRYILLQLAVIALLAAGTEYFTDRAVREMGLSQNEQIAVTWHHFFYMGLNEDATGGYNGDDKGMFGEFQDKPRSVRNAAELERAWGRIKNRGFWGSLHFWLLKMVMTFNDGTFGWGPEGGFDYGFYPVADNDAMTELLRDIFWKERRFMGHYNTFCQSVWITLLLGIPGLCFCRRERRGEMLVFPVIFIGIFLYILLFEARARYLLCFAPLLCVMAILGMCQYAEWAHKCVRMVRHPWE